MREICGKMPVLMWHHLGCGISLSLFLYAHCAPPRRSHAPSKKVKGVVHTVANLWGEVSLWSGEGKLFLSFEARQGINWSIQKKRGLEMRQNLVVGDQTIRWPLQSPNFSLIFDLNPRASQTGEKWQCSRLQSLFSWPLCQSSARCPYLKRRRTRVKEGPIRSSSVITPMFGIPNTITRRPKRRSRPS